MVLRLYQWAYIWYRKIVNRYYIDKEVDCVVFRRFKYYGQKKEKTSRSGGVRLTVKGELFEI